MKKVYLGDGVFAEFDGFAIILTTENGVSVTNRIVLEPEVVRDLGTFILEARRSEKGDHK